MGLGTMFVTKSEILSQKIGGELSVSLSSYLRKGNNLIGKLLVIIDDTSDRFRYSNFERKCNSAIFEKPRGS